MMQLQCNRLGQNVFEFIPMCIKLGIPRPSPRVLNRQHFICTGLLVFRKIDLEQRWSWQYAAFIKICPIKKTASFLHFRWRMVFLLPAPETWGDNVFSLFTPAVGVSGPVQMEDTPAKFRWGGQYPGQGWGTPSQVLSYGVPPQDRTADGVLDKRRKVYLLRSHRRTFLFHKYSFLWKTSKLSQ